MRIPHCYRSSFVARKGLMLLPQVTMNDKGVPGVMETLPAEVTTIDLLNCAIRTAPGENFATGRAWPRMAGTLLDVAIRGSQSVRTAPPVSPLQAWECKKCGLVFAGDISGKNHRATGEGAAEFRGTATKSLPEFRGAQIRRMASVSSGVSLFAIADMIDMSK